MGIGYCFKCKKCQNEYKVFLGVGMMYSTVYNDFVKEIIRGDYGSKRQELMKSHPFAAVNARSEFYLCGNCGYWEVGKDASLYLPKGAEDVVLSDNNPELGENGILPFISSYELRKNYRILMRYRKRCIKCGKYMHRIPWSEIDEVPCTRCGEKNSVDSIINWD